MANRPETKTNESAADAAPPAAAPRGGIKPWLPLIATVVLMPVLAYAMTVFVLLPKLNAAVGTQGDGSESHGASTSAKSAAANKVTVPLGSKVLVNLSGSMGTRYLVASITIVGTSSTLKAAVEKNDAQLLDVAASVLATKTIGDLDKPGARNLVRTELVSAFSNVLGPGSVTEIYFTEFAIQ